MNKPTCSAFELVSPSMEDQGKISKKMVINECKRVRSPASQMCEPDFVKNSGDGGRPWSLTWHSLSRQSSWHLASGFDGFHPQFISSDQHLFATNFADKIFSLNGSFCGHIDFPSFADFAVQDCAIRDSRVLGSFGGALHWLTGAT